MEEGQWDLWAPLEKTLECVNSYDSFLTQCSLLFGRSITSAAAFIDECYMYRRKGDWKDLLRLILNHIPNEVRIDIMRRCDTHDDIIYHTVQNVAYSVKNVHNHKKADKTTGKTIHVGELPVFGSDYWIALITNKPAKKLPRPIFHRICAFLRVCKYHHVNTDIRKLLVFILRNLEVDYILCFRAICGRNMEELKSNTQTLIPYQLKRQAYLPSNRDAIVHRATHCAVSQGWFDLNVLDIVVKNYIGNHYNGIIQTALNWIAWRRREITYSFYMESQQRAETTEEFLSSRKDFSLSLVKSFPKDMFHVYRFDWNPKVMDPIWYAKIMREFIRTNPALYKDNITRRFEANAMLRKVIHYLQE